MRTALLSKTARTGLWFVLLCGLCLAVSNQKRWSLCSDWRFAQLRELEQVGDTAADVLFLGTSATARGVMPQAFEEQVERAGLPATRALNLGTMGIAHQIGFNQLMSYLDAHEGSQPKVVFVEFGLGDLIQWPHQRAVNFMPPTDALRVASRRPFRYRDSRHYGKLPPPVRGEPNAADAWKLFHEWERVQLNLVLAVGALGRGPGDLARVFKNRIGNGLDGRGWDNPYRRETRQNEEILPEDTAEVLAVDGWYDIPPDASDAVLGKQSMARHRERLGQDQPWLALSKFAEYGREEFYRASKVYAAEISELCHVQGIELVFMELPKYFEPGLDPEQEQAFEQWGRVFRPNMEELQTEANYQDTGHLSREGADWYSRQLADVYIDIVKSD